ncbi:sigma-70 family RNA polymerase sigma factor [Arthrobacter alpinus]|uniref:sigma-70 family RNA polymerase sigma factor n=1 Tax=Arthrobacter alpinus TaxID=656366 RepID=UPI0009444582
MKKNYELDEPSSARRKQKASLPDDAASDGQLIELVRAGGTPAYEELYRRHVSVATSVARKHVDNYSDADDVVAEAFASVFESLLAGKGPDCFFRAYLLCAVSRISHQKNRARGKTTPTDDLLILDKEFLDEDPALQSFEEKTIVAAFKALPERWQAALWYIDIEGMKPAAAAPLLGLSSNAVSSLVGRAREGLSQNYLQNHITSTADSACAQYAVQLGAFVRNGLNGSTTKRIDAHLEKCEECSAVLADLADVQSSLRAGIFPLVAGMAFWDPSTTMPSASAIGSGRWPDFKHWLQLSGSPALTVASGSAVAIVLVAAATALATQGFGAWAISSAQETLAAAPESSATAAAAPAGPAHAAGTSASPSAPPSASAVSSAPSSAPAPAPTAAPTSSPFPTAPAPAPTAPPTSSFFKAAPVPVPTAAPTSLPFPTAPAPAPTAPSTSSFFKASSATVATAIGPSSVAAMESGRCLTIVEPAGIQLIIADCVDSGGPQRWAYDAATGTLSATVADATYCLDAEGSGTGNGTHVIAWTCTGQPNQRWTVDQTNKTIIGVPSGRCLSIQDAETSNNSQVELWDCTANSINQQWMVAPDHD